MVVEAVPTLVSRVKDLSLVRGLESLLAQVRVLVLVLVQVQALSELGSRT